MKIYRVRVCQTRYWDVQVSAPNEREAEIAAEDDVSDGVFNMSGSSTTPVYESENAKFLYTQTDAEFARLLNDEKTI